MSDKFVVMITEYILLLLLIVFTILFERLLDSFKWCDYVYESEIWYLRFQRIFNSFQTIASLSHSPKGSVNQRFSDAFRGYKNRTKTWNGLLNTT